MKKIHLLVLKAFVRPFIVTFFIVMFVLLMLFLWKYIDDLIGKGFEWYVILELMLYASATNVAMALPLSVLLSSIMTYGTLGENYELVAIKSAGVSLTRAMYPMMIAVTLLSVAAFYFSEYMLPVANLKFYSLLYDVRQQKSASLIKEGIFNNSFPGYCIRVEHNDKDGQTLHGIMIYERPPGSTLNNVIFAKQGLMFKTPDNKYLVLKLKNGIRYEEGPGRNGGFNPRQTLTRFRFDETVQKLDLSGFSIHRTNEEDFRTNFLMLNTHQLVYMRDSVKKVYDKNKRYNYSGMLPYIKFFSFPHSPAPLRKVAIAGNNALSLVDKNNRIMSISNAMTEARSLYDISKSKGDAYIEEEKILRRYMVEFNKKFTLSAACIVLFLIGAPLGSIIRKGGLGMPVVISVVFFLIYYIISTIGEKSAKDASISPFLGTWIAIFVLLPVGIFLSYKAATDSALFDMENYKRFFTNLFYRFKKTEKA